MFSVQQAKVENLQRPYEIDDNPDRKAWLDRLLSFMEERGTPITQCPTISKNPLDLYKLYMYTKDRGGYLEVLTPPYCQILEKFNFCQIWGSIKCCGNGMRCC